MTVGELIQKYGIEYIGRFYSIYRGVVLDNQDSDNIGKLLIIIPSIHDGVKVWARPYNNPGSINSGVKWLIPRVGDIVWVQFEMGDPMRPIWSYHSWGIGEVPEELQSNDTIGLVTPTGNKIYISEVDGSLTIILNQKVTIQVIDGSSITIDGSSITIDGGDKLTINSSDTILNGGSNGGLVNVDSLRNLVTSIQTDLATVGSGTQVTAWMVDGMVNIEDTKVKH